MIDTSPTLSLISWRSMGFVRGDDNALLVVALEAGHRDAPAVIAGHPIGEDERASAVGGEGVGLFRLAVDEADFGPGNGPAGLIDNVAADLSGNALGRQSAGGGEQHRERHYGGAKCFMDFSPQGGEMRARPFLTSPAGKG